MSDLPCKNDALQMHRDVMEDIAEESSTIRSKAREAEKVLGVLEL